MTLITSKEYPFCARLTGRIGKPLPVGQPECYGIYQIKHTRNGPMTSKNKFYTFKNGYTPEREKQRQKMRQAVHAWHDLTPEQKGEYNKKARRDHFYGFNLFVKKYLLSH
ncbi:MAG TPA: hypothetical protein PLQ44_03050 [Candidatus Paceibacterota bacterium]|nr:hypothetical protein [Candidatus Paceibacterota bacterium]